MLMKTPRLDIVHEIVFHQYARTALISIQPPSTVCVSVYIVKNIVGYNRSLRWPQRIYPAHIAEHSLPYVVHMVIT